jgi:hypothetical protein
VRHRAERTLPYQLVGEYYPAFKAHLAAQGTDLPGYVQQEFDDYLKCGRLGHGFLRDRCETCHAENLMAFSVKNGGFYPGHPAHRLIGGSLRLFKIAPGYFVSRAAAPGAWPRAPHG